MTNKIIFSPGVDLPELKPMVDTVNDYYSLDFIPSALKHLQETLEKIPSTPETVDDHAQIRQSRALTSTQILQKNFRYNFEALSIFYQEHIKSIKRLFCCVEPYKKIYTSVLDLQKKLDELTQSANADYSKKLNALYRDSQTIRLQMKMHRNINADYQKVKDLRDDRLEAFDSIFEGVDDDALSGILHWRKRDLPSLIGIKPSLIGFNFNGVIPWENIIKFHKKSIDEINGIIDSLIDIRKVLLTRSNTTLAELENQITSLANTHKVDLEDPLTSEKVPAQYHGYFFLKQEHQNAASSSSASSSYSCN